MSLQPTWDSEQRKETATPVTAHAWGQAHADHVYVWTVCHRHCLQSSLENRGQGEKRTTMTHTSQGFNTSFLRCSS